MLVTLGLRDQLVNLTKIWIRLRDSAFLTGGADAGGLGLVILPRISEEFVVGDFQLILVWHLVQCLPSVLDSKLHAGR